MLQDLPQGRLENEFRHTPPQNTDRVICVRNRDILLRKDPDETLHLPTIAQVCAWSGTWEAWEGENLQYAFRMQEENYFLFLGTAGDCPVPEYTYLPAHTLRQRISREICYAAMTGWHLYNWYKNNRFCGCCGGKTRKDAAERMLRCPNCGNLIFPWISPAVIVGVTDGDRILLTKYAGRSYTQYALIAGYTEIGETLEQTIHREVMEEVGLKVKNIRYYASQPWGIDGNILMGFYCDLDGDDTIRLDQQELALGQWHHRDAIPTGDDGISITREMIRVFAEGKEPK